MKLSKLQLVGFIVLVAAALAIALLQLSGHGILSHVDYPPTPPEVAAHGGKLIRRIAIFTPLSIRVCKWAAAVGIVCLLIPLISKRGQANA